MDSKFQQIQSKIYNQGMDLEEATTYVGECMDEKDRVFTESDIRWTINYTISEVKNILQNHPDALDALAIHFK